MAAGNTGLRSGQGFYRWDEERRERQLNRHGHQLRLLSNPEPIEQEHRCRPTGCMLLAAPMAYGRIREKLPGHFLLHYYSHSCQISDPRKLRRGVTLTLDGSAEHGIVGARFRVGECFMYSERF